MAQPVEPGLAIGRVEDVLERVAAMARSHARCDGEQVPVVVAEHARGGVAEVAEAPEHAERIGPAVDEVAEHVEAVARRREAGFREQPVEGVGAALDVAHEEVHGFDSATLPARHRCARAWTLPSCSS